MHQTISSDFAANLSSATMHPTKATPPSPEPKTWWNFDPSLAASILFLVLFSLTTGAHIFQAIFHRKLYCWVVAMSGTWQTFTYIFRTISVQRRQSFDPYAAWFILILVAPLWTNAFVYMVFGRMVWNYMPGRRVWKVQAWLFGVVFVVLDVFAFVVQILGAVRASKKNAKPDDVLAGLHIYMIGVGIQLFFILIFCAFGFRLFLQARADRKREPNRRDPRNCMLLLYTGFAALFLIAVRIVFRICEYSQGLDSKIPNHEVYQYCLDSLPMLLALVVFNLVHPGRVMKGKEHDMPSLSKQRQMRKQRKRSEQSDEMEMHSVSHGEYKPG